MTALAAGVGACGYRVLLLSGTDSAAEEIKSSTRRVRMGEERAKKCIADDPGLY